MWIPDAVTLCLSLWSVLVSLQVLRRLHFPNSLKHIPDIWDICSSYVDECLDPCEQSVYSTVNDFNTWALSVPASLWLLNKSTYNAFEWSKCSIVMRLPRMHHTRKPEKWSRLKNDKMLLQGFQYKYFQTGSNPHCSLSFWGWDWITWIVRKFKEIFRQNIIKV